MYIDRQLEQVHVNSKMILEYDSPDVWKRPLGH